MIYFSSSGESNDPGGEGCLDNTTGEKRLYKWTVLSETRKKNRRLRRTRTTALKDAADDGQGIVLPPQAGQGEVNLNCSKGDLDQKVKFPNFRHCETLEEIAWGAYRISVAEGF